MDRQHGLNNQQQSLFRGHPNMNGEPSPVHISGEERSLLIFNYVTPNKLFKDTKKLENTKVLKDPEGKEENSFVPF